MGKGEDREEEDIAEKKEDAEKIPDGEGDQSLGSG